MQYGIRRTSVGRITMGRFLLVSLSVLGVICEAIGHPAIVWSNKKILGIDQNNDIVDLQRLFQVAAHFNGVSVNFVDSNLTPNRVSFAYKSLAPLATSATFYKSYIDHPTYFQSVELPNVASSFPTPIESHKLTVVDLSKKENPVNTIKEYVNQFGDRPFLVIISRPIVEQESSGSLIEEPQKLGDKSAVTGLRRRLQDTATTPKPYEIKIRPHDLPAALFMIGFVICLFVGISCLADVNTPISYEDKTLVLNKEF